MDEKKFVAYLFRYMLTETFKTKAAMARALGVSLQTLRLNFKNLDCAKGGTTAFEKLVVYCCLHRIELVTIHDMYKDEVSMLVKKGRVRELIKAQRILTVFKPQRMSGLTVSLRRRNVLILINHTHCYRCCA